MRMICLGISVGATAALAQELEQRDTSEYSRRSAYIDDWIEDDRRRVVNKPNTVSQAKRRKYKRQRGRK